MKKVLLLSSFILLALLGKGQNLVPNGSFEQYTSCPNSPALLTNATNWIGCSNGGNAEYFNACSPQGNMSVPFNVEGYQYAADGVAYIGMGIYVMHDTSKYCHYNEPAGASLITPMVIGQKYFVSFKVVLTIDTISAGCGGDPGCASNKIGALFSTVQYSESSPAPRKNFAQIYTNSIITDTINWTTISGTFVADSAYTFICIGGFFDSLHTQVIQYYPACPYLTQSYYFIDDIRVSTDSLYGLSVGINRISKSDNHFSIYPNPSTGLIKIKLPDNTDRTNISVYNIFGQILYSNNVYDKENIDLSFLYNGVYTIILKNSSNQYSTKLLIHK